MPEYKNTAGRKKPQKPNKILNALRLGIFWLIVLLLCSAIFTSLTGDGYGKNEERTLTEILSYAKEEKLEKIEVTGNDLKVTAKDNVDLPKVMISRKDGSGTLQEQGFEEVINEGKVSIEIKDNTETITRIMNSEDIDHNSKETYVERLETTVDKIEKIVNPDDQKVVMAHKRADYSSDNVMAFFKKFGLTADLISFINSNPTELDYLSDSEEESLNSFLDACLVEEDINNDKYQQIIRNICDCIQDFSVEGLSEEKFEILVRLSKIEMNLANLQFIRSAYPTQVLTYIRNDVERYMSIVTVSDFNVEEMKNIIEWPEVDDQKKIELLKQTDEPVCVEDKPFSDELVIYVLANNLYEADMPWLLRNYSGFSDEVKKAVLQVASNMVEQIASTYSDDVDNILLNLLFRSERVDFEGKIQLLEKTANSMSIEELCVVLRQLDADKIADNIAGGKKRAKITEENKQIHFPDPPPPTGCHRHHTG